MLQYIKIGSEAQGMASTQNLLYTIGYAGFESREKFISSLAEHGVGVLIDVRSTPYSAYYEDYNREALEQSLAKRGIHYRNWAHEFGARQEDRSFYRDGRLDFELFTASPQFDAGREKLLTCMEKGYTPALMCAEKDPKTCHRAVMISHALAARGFRVVHIMADGADKTQPQLDGELLELYFPDRAQLSLFGTADDGELLREAYRLQNDKIGFKEAELG